MKCDICGNEGAKIRKVTEAYGKDSDLLIIQNIPLVSCPLCGESYFTAQTLHEIENIKFQRKKFAVERLIEVAEYKGDENPHF